MKVGAGFAGFAALFPTPKNARVQRHSHTHFVGAGKNRAKPAKPARRSGVSVSYASDPTPIAAPVAHLSASAGLPSLAIRSERGDRRTLDVSGRPGSSTRLRASQGPGPGDDDGAEDLGELDPNAPSTVSLYDAPLNPYRGGLLDPPETDEAEALARGHAGPERRRDVTAAVTRQPPLRRARNPRFRPGATGPPPTVGEVPWRAGCVFSRKRLRNPNS